MKFRLSLLASALLLLSAPLSMAQVNCNAQIIDQTGLIHNPQVITAASRTLINQGADVHVVIVDRIQRYGTSLADVQRSFETSCPSWTTNGIRKANLFVVMVAPNDRAKNIFLGSYYNGAFDVASTYSQTSNAFFKNRQWEDGIAAVLQSTTGQALAFRQRVITAQNQRTVAPPPVRTYSATTTPPDTGSSHAGLWIFGLVVLGLIGLTLYLLFRRGNGVDTYSTGTTTPSADTTPVAGPTSYRRSYAASAGASAPSYAPPVSHTTVINNNDSGNGLLTGLVVGEMLSRPSPQTVYVEPSSSPVYAPSTPSYSEPAPVQDAPDSSWEEPAAAQPDTSFSPDPEPSQPDTDFGSSSSDSSSSDSGWGGGDSSSSGDSGF
jgi:uncharacterized membrane protein YgcG